MFGISTKSNAQFYSVRTDALGLLTGSFNVEGSMALNRNWSVHLHGQWNPFTHKDNIKMKNVTVMPGVRYWFRETYGHSWFIGGNLIGSRFNVGGIFDNRRYDGRLWGGGISGGFSMPLAVRWNMEFELGVFAAYGSYDKFGCKKCDAKLSEKEGLIVGPSKAAVAFVFLF